VNPKAHAAYNFNMRYNKLKEFTRSEAVTYTVIA